MKSGLATRPTAPTFGGRSVRDVLFVVLVLATAVMIGAAVALAPIIGLAAAGGLGALWLFSYGQRMIPVFHVALIAILVGYAFLGRGMAYIGVAPLFVGEMVLGLGLLAIVVSLPTARWHPVHLAIALFMAWGLIRTVPYIGTWGIDALRDGVAYGYAVFAVAVSLTVRRLHIAPLLQMYQRWIPVFVLWVPVAAIAYTVFEPNLPRVPNSDVPIFVFKGGDTGVHLGAMGTFMILGLGGHTHQVRDALTWLGWIVAVGVTGVLNRGGMVAASTMALALLFGRSTRWFSLVLVGLFLVVVVGLVDPQVDIGVARRISVDQIVANATSVFGGGDAVLDGTKAWRLQWWDKIIQYTIGGEYFWSGKGYGINLADADGFQVTADGSLRAPHNGHIEVLARAGVPGLLLWIGVQLAFGLTMLRAATRARRAGLARWVAIVGWVTVYWLAALVNTSFDVYLQNPMGGIWFWSIVGLGIAVAQIVDRIIAERADRPAGDPGAVAAASV